MEHPVIQWRTQETIFIVSAVQLLTYCIITFVVGYCWSRPLAGSCNTLCSPGYPQCLSTAI